MLILLNGLPWISPCVMTPVFAQQQPIPPQPRPQYRFLQTAAAYDYWLDNRGKTYIRYRAGPGVFSVCVDGCRYVGCGAEGGRLYATYLIRSGATNQEWFLVLDMEPGELHRGLILNVRDGDDSRFYRVANVTRFGSCQMVEHEPR